MVKTTSARMVEMELNIVLCTRNRLRLFVGDDVKGKFEKTVDGIVELYGAKCLGVDYGVIAPDGERAFVESAAVLHLRFYGPFLPEEVVSDIRRAAWDELSDMTPGSRTNPLVRDYYMADVPSYSEERAFVFVVEQTWRRGNRNERLRSYYQSFAQCVE